MEFGHSEGTFTLKNFWVSIVKVPSELQNSQNLTRDSRFVIATHLAPVASGTNNKPQIFFFGAFIWDQYGMENPPGRACCIQHLTLI